MLIEFVIKFKHVAPPSYMECVTSEEMAAGTDPETSELMVFETKDQAMFFLWLQFFLLYLQRFQIVQ